MFKGQNVRFKHPKDRTIRIKKRFLFLPRRINGITKWLEIAKWEEIYRSFVDTGWWESACWIEEKDDKRKI
jgi:hypothetical protein